MRPQLQDFFGGEAAPLPMDFLPGRWSALVTVTVLDAKLEATGRACVPRSEPS